MKKYLWRCESNTCNNEFKADNPNDCPKCGGDDIMIVEESSLPLSDTAKKVFIGILSLLLIGLIYMSWDKIFPEDNGVLGSDGVTEYIITTELSDNYFSVSGVDVDELGLHAINLLTGERIYSKGNNFYPCENGNFLIKWDENQNLIIKGDRKIKNFKLRINAHKNACEPLPLIVESIDVSESCVYTIFTNMDNDTNLEVSLNKNTGFVKGKLEWEKSEISGSSFFYLRIKRSNQITKAKIPFCTIESEAPNSPDAPAASVVCNSFKLYISDIKNNRTQFTDMLKRYGTIIEFEGVEQDLQEFCIELRTRSRNEGNSKISLLSLSTNNVFYSSNRKKIIKLKITK